MSPWFSRPDRLPPTVFNVLSLEAACWSITEAWGCGVGVGTALRGMSGDRMSENDVTMVHSAFGTGQAMILRSAPEESTRQLHGDPAAAWRSKGCAAGVPTLCTCARCIALPPVRSTWVVGQPLDPGACSQWVHLAPAALQPAFFTSHAP